MISASGALVLFANLFVFAIFFFFSKRDRTIAARVESTFGVLLEIYFLIILLPLWAGARVRARLF